MLHDLSIIIVNFNSVEHLTKCICSIQKQNTDLSYEIIVVDNNSSDNSKMLITNAYPDVRWVDSGYNAGFARANNLGITYATGRLIMILNPDTEMTNGFIEKFVSAYNERSKTCTLGIAGCKIISSEDNSLLIGSGTEFPSFKRTLFANPLLILVARLLNINLDRKYDPHLMHNTDHEVDFVSGACAMISKQNIENYNLYFDEDFFLYYEDVEWSYRVQQHGLINYFFSSITILHENSAVTKKSGNKDKQLLLSSFLFYFKTMNHVLYFLHGVLMSLNYLLNSLLLKRAGNYELYQQMKMQQSIFRHFYFKVPFRFKRKPSSSKNFLRYVEQA